MLDATVRFLPADEGGRSTPPWSGYRCPVWFGQVGSDGTELLWDFAFDFPGRPPDEPVPFGADVRVTMRAATATPADLPIAARATFEVREGSRVVGRGRVDARWSGSSAAIRGLPYWWRVTRYDPACRDERGGYVGETWTSISDVGKSFDGEQLTRDEYERVESAYVEAALAFAEDSGVEEIEPRRFEPDGRLVKGAAVGLREVPALIRAMLREEPDSPARLETPHDDFAIHVGFDLYMYIGSQHSCEHAVERAAGLLPDVERIPTSPWIAEDD